MFHTLCTILRVGKHNTHPSLIPTPQGAHVTINARSEMDLDEDEVLKKVATASGSKFSVHKEKARPMPEAAPVVS